MRLSQQAALFWAAQRAAETEKGVDAAREAALSIAVYSDDDCILDRAAIFLFRRFGIEVYPFEPDVDRYEGKVIYSRDSKLEEARVKPLREAAAALGIAA